MPSDGERLFVYGTLRRGSGHRMQAVLGGAAEFVDEAVFQGRLYRISRYPGAVSSNDSRERVVGDVFRLLEPRRLLIRLDRYEGCDPRNSRALFVRKRCLVTLGSGEEVSAWVYLYNGDTANLERIRSGDFLGHAHGVTAVVRGKHRPLEREGRSSSTNSIPSHRSRRSRR